MGDSNKIIVGGLYASIDEDGRYRVLKVLVVDEFAVHLRSYADRFDELPAGITSSQLSLGGFGAAEGVGIGHFPVSRQGFRPDIRMLIGKEPVNYDELEGYRIWAGLDTVE